MKRLYVWDDGNGKPAIVAIALSQKQAIELANKVMQLSSVDLVLPMDAMPNKIIDLGASWAGPQVILCPGLHKDRLYHSQFGFVDAANRSAFTKQEIVR